MAAPVVTCQAAPAQLMDYLAIWTRGHVETRRHGDVDMLTTLLMTTAHQATEHLVLGIMVLVCAGH